MNAMALDTKHRKTTLDEDAAIYASNRELNEKEQWKAMNKEEKRIQFKEYYMIPIIAGLVASFIIGFLIYDAVINHREVVYMTTIINDMMDTEKLEEFNNDLLLQLGYSEKKHEVRFADNYLLSGGTSADTLNTTEAITSYIYAKQLDSMIADTESFNHYASLGCFYDLREILSEEQYALYEPYLYYPELEAPDNNSPSSAMGSRPTETYPCGIILSERKKYKSLGGAQTKPIIGFLITSSHVDNTADILEYLFDNVSN